MTIKELFLNLTGRTYPHGTEDALFSFLKEMAPDLSQDEFGNLFIKIGESDVMFTSHLDTATSALTDVIHVEEDNIIKTDGKSILGADDKAGVTIMLHMIQNKIPGLYYFFLGEEVGCVGSKKLADKLSTDKLEYLNKVISFDRRGTDSVITYQASSRCCSDEFGQALATQLNTAETTFKYKNDPTGVYTDSAKFTKIYPECSNISVGYYSEHTFSERQDIKHLELLANACLKVDWLALPVKRDPSKTDYYYSGYEYGGWGGYYGRRSAYTPSSSPASTATYPWDEESGFRSNASSVPETRWFNDAKFNAIAQYQIDRNSGKLLKVDLCAERVLHEKKLIEELLTKLELPYDYLTWDAKDCKVYYNVTSDLPIMKQCDRMDIMEYLPELDLEKMENKAVFKDTPVSLVDDDYCGDL